MKQKNQTVFNESFPLSYVPSINSFNSSKIAFAPNTSDAANEIMRIFSNASSYQNISTVGFKSRSDMLSSINNNEALTEFLCGIYFKNISEQLITNISYEISFPNDLRFPPSDSGNSTWETDKILYSGFSGPRDASLECGGYPSYYEEGYATVQYILESSIIAFNKKPGLESLTLQRYPYPKFKSDTFQKVVGLLLGVTIIFGFMFCSLTLIRNIVFEKEMRLREMMKMMGLPNWAVWVGYSIYYGIIFSIIALIISFFLLIPFSKYGAVVSKSSPALFIIFLIIYIFSLISLSFFISALANTAQVATIIQIFFTLITFSPITLIQNGTIPNFFGYLFCIFPNTAMGVGCLILGYAEQYDGQHFYNLMDVFHNVTFDMSFLWILVSLGFDTLFYAFLAWYIDSIKPGEYGVAKPVNFLFTKSFWCKTNAGDDIERDVEKTAELQDTCNLEYFEAEPIKKIGIQLENLVKKFGAKVAVKNMNFNIFTNELTVLLGHNGAGKTTTMSMITGFISPTSGKIIVNGLNIKDSLELVRKQFGLCPQYDVLFNKLTVREHFYFYGKLKGLTTEECLQEMEHYTKALEIHHKVDTLSKDLSGGMKRKLSLSIAMLGDSKVIILDEPTSGMDPSARRVTWDFLLKQKEHKTILLTTHYMDEADVLGDRIAIMADGNLECCGSSLFLKNKYGAGYNLVIVKNEEANISQLEAVIQAHVPTAYFESNYASEVTFILPNKEISNFPGLFNTLENSQKQLGIESYGVAQTTIEEVFLKVGKLRDASEEEFYDISGKYRSSSLVRFPKHHSKHVCDDPEDYNDEIELVPSNKLNTGIRLLVQQVKAMTIKKLINAKRSWFLTIGQVAVPILYTVIAMLFNLSIKTTADDYQTLAMLLSDYSNVNILAAYDSKNYSSTEMYQSFRKSAAVHPSQKLTITKIEETNFEDYMLGLTLASYDDYVIGIDLSNSLNPKAWFNNQAYHSVPLIINLISNTLLFQEPTKAFLRSSNSPLPPLSVHSLPQNSSAVMLAGLMTGIFLCFATGFVISSFVFFLVKERANGAKHQQFVSGVSYVVYWLVSGIFDFLTYLISIVIPLAIVYGFKLQAYANERFLALVIVTALNGWASMYFTYCITFFFITPAKAFGRTLLVLLIVGFAPMIFVAAQLIINPSKNIDGIIWIFSVSPYFGYPMSVLDLNINYNTHLQCQQLKISPKRCGDYLTPYNIDYFGWDRPGIFKYIIMMIAQGFIWLAVILIVESDLIKRMACHRKTCLSNEEQKENIDGDVDEEHKRIMKKNAADDILRLEGLNKIFKTDGKVLHAVRGLYLGIPKGECFGLLGVNGAGKTTTMKMLTGDIPMSKGDAYIKNYSVNTAIKRAQRELGYCPQFDALIGLMTVKETLSMYANIRGVQCCQIDSTIERLMTSLNFKKFANHQTKNLSGGNRRKLSTAIAMIGNPPLVFLDEPSAGMDPGARRKMWDFISHVRGEGTSVVLTSHSMDECEALCTRLAIMVNGQFMCLGSPQHLKSKFGSGYMVIIKVRHKDNVSALMEYFKTTFESYNIKDQHQTTFHIEIPQGISSWSTLFSELETNKDDLNIVDYSVSQTTLEQIFISFANAQFD